MKDGARKNGEKGQALVLVVAALGLCMLAGLGLGIDGAQLYAHRQMAQAAADAAAQAAVMSILRGTNATSAYPFSTGSSFTCAVPPATPDPRTPCVYAQYNGFGTSSDTVTVSFPSTVAGVTLSSDPSPAAAVTVQRRLQTGLMRFAGVAATTIMAKATAGITASVPPTCLYVLAKTAPGAFVASGGVSVSMNCGIVINDSDSSSASVSGGAQVTASAVSIAGGYVVSGGGSISPTPVTNSQSVTDPFLSAPAPATGSCNYTNYSAGPGNWTLNPGTYCGGISISGGGSVTLNQGTYVLNGGGLSISGGATVTGSGVMVYLTGSNASYRSVSISGGSQVTLSAQTSGPYPGLLFYQDRAISSLQNATFSGGAAMQLSGSLYFPTTSISFSGGTSGSATTALIAQKVSFSGGTRLVYDPTGIKTGLVSRTVALIE